MSADDMDAFFSGAKECIDEQIRAFFIDVCHREAISDYPAISNKLLTLASATIGRDKFYDIFVAAAQAEAKQDVAKACRFLRLGLDSNSPVSYFFSPAKEIRSFFNLPNSLEKSLSLEIKKVMQSIDDSLSAESGLRR